MIICGYAGVGKSTAAKKIVNVVDLESTPFNKDWETYARVAKHMSDHGYIVLVSCHEGLRREFQRQGISYYVVYPDPSLKESYRRKYIERGNTQEFVETQMKNWEDWVGHDLFWEDDEGISRVERSFYLCVTPSGHEENLCDFLDDIIMYGEGVINLMPEAGNF